MRRKDRPHYSRWMHMRERCNSPSFKEYKYWGGRGIKICKEWEDFEVFQKWCLDTYIPGRSLDRINNDGDYSPDNCRWATASEQCKNQRHDTPKRKLAQKFAANAMHQKLHSVYGNPKTRVQKLCGRCKQMLPVSFFRKGSNKNHAQFGYCIPCHREYERIRYYRRKREKESRKAQGQS